MRQRASGTEGVAKSVGHEREPDKAVAVEPGQHPRRQRTGHDPAEQHVIRHEERGLERLEALMPILSQARAPIQPSS